MRGTTPKAIDPNVLRLRNKIGLSTEPVFVPVHPVGGAKHDECFDNVRRHSTKEGGESAFGWLVWELRNKWIEGVFHAVWRSPRGDLLDITPHIGNEQGVLFIPDPTRVYEGRPVRSERIALSDDRRVQWTIAFQNVLDEASARYNTPDGSGQMPASVLIEMMHLITGPNDPCPCHSGKDFGDCCSMVPPDTRENRWLQTVSGFVRRSTMKG